MGLRKVRKGETVRVRSGLLVGQHGTVLDAGEHYAVIDFGNAGTSTMALDDLVRIVDSATDAEDWQLAKGQFAEIDVMLGKIAENIYAFEQAEIEKAAREVGLPEEILIGLGLLPEVHRLAEATDGRTANVLRKIASGLATAASVIGIAKPVVEKLLGR